MRPKIARFHPAFDVAFLCVETSTEFRPSWRINYLPYMETIWRLQSVTDGAHPVGAWPGFRLQVLLFLIARKDSVVSTSTSLFALCTRLGRLNSTHWIAVSKEQKREETETGARVAI
jgi:hypothetical protein